jgi:hypothetical protein
VLRHCRYGTAMGSASFKQIAGGLAIAAVLLAAHLLPSHGDQPLRRDHTRDWSYLKVPHREPTPLESRLGEIASLVALRPVQVRCEEFSTGTAEEPGGIVQFDGSSPADYTRIRPDVCTAMVKFMREPATARLDSAVALKVLAHESFHLQGIKTEAIAECYAMEALPRVAHGLGATVQEGRAMATAVYDYVYPRMPPLYRSGDCRPGGPLDLHPGGGWPD